MWKKECVPLASLIQSYLYNHCEIPPASLPMQLQAGFSSHRLSVVEWLWSLNAKG